MKPGLGAGASYSSLEERRIPASIRALGAGPPTYWIGEIAGTIERTARKWMSDFVEDDEQTVGADLCIRRGDPTITGEKIVAVCELSGQRGRRYVFDVTALNENGVELARGTHERVLINQRRFAQPNEPPSTTD